MANMQMDMNRFYARHYELTKDLMNNVNNKIGRFIRYNIILQSIQEYKQIANNIRISQDGTGVRITNYRGGYLTFNPASRNAIYLTEKTDPEWKYFIRILNRKFYEGRNLYNAYLEKVKELCQVDICDCCGKSQDILNINDYGICNCWCSNCGNLYRECGCNKEDNINVKLLIKKFPIDAYDVKVEYITTTKMMIKGKEINSNKARIFRNSQAIVYCDITGHSFRGENYEYFKYLNSITDGLSEFSDELILLNINLRNELIDEMPYLTETPDYEECCVCYDIINTKTKNCNHSLCKTCVNALRGQKKCPLCRGGL